MNGWRKMINIEVDQEKPENRLTFAGNWFRSFVHEFKTAGCMFEHGLDFDCNSFLDAIGWWSY